MTYRSFLFELQLGTDRRILLTELSDWLQESVGEGSIRLDFSREIYEYQKDWYIQTRSDGFRVLLKEERDATLFALKWT
jgi:hypothetical protein